MPLTVGSNCSVGLQPVTRSRPVIPRGRCWRQSDRRAFPVAPIMSNRMQRGLPPPLHTPAEGTVAPRVKHLTGIFDCELPAQLPDDQLGPFLV